LTILQIDTYHIRCCHSANLKPKPKSAQTLRLSYIHTILSDVQCNMLFRRSEQVNDCSCVSSRKQQPRSKPSLLTTVQHQTSIPRQLSRVPSLAAFDNIKDNNNIPTPTPPRPFTQHPGIFTLIYPSIIMLLVSTRTLGFIRNLCQLQGCMKSHRLG
jgi:hypothetical protein